MARSAMEKDVIKAFLGDETEFKGLLSFEGTVRIDGKFEGEVVTKDNLIIGENAEVRAQIKVGALMVQGKLEGDVTAEKKVSITSKGRLIGNVATPSLNIEDGALLDGAISMIKREEGNVRPLVLKKGERPQAAEIGGSGGGSGSSPAAGA